MRPLSWTARELHELQALYASAYSEPPWNEGPLDQRAFAYRLNLERDRGATGWCMADSYDRVQGFAYALPPCSPFPTGRAYERVARICNSTSLETRWEVMELAIGPEFRGQGHATRLLNQLLQDCAPAWVLTSANAAAAVRLYGRHPQLVEIGAGEGLRVFATR